jgi:putative transposase
MIKRLVFRFIKTFRKKSFADAVIWFIMYFVKLYYPGNVDAKKTLLPAAYASCRGITISMAVKELKRKGYEVHSNKTVLNTLANFPAFSVEKMTVKAREIVIRVARKYGLTKRRTIVSIDFHDKPFYGDHELKEVVGTKHKLGTNYAYRYATICICEEGMRFNLATVAVTQLNSRKAVVLNLIKEAKKYVKIGEVLLDRGFNDTDIIDLLKEEIEARYTMPLTENKKVKRISADMKCIVTMPYTFYENRPKEYQTTVKLIVDKREKEAHYFITNIAGENKTALLLIIEAYRKRWGIETGYRVADEFYAWTTSKKFFIRCFLGLLSFLMQDLWVLQNFIGQKGTPFQQARSKLLKGCRKILQFLKKSVQELSFYWRPEIEAELFREDIADAIKKILNR